MYSATTDDDDLVMVVGPATTGNLLEIGCWTVAVTTRS
jgi:hypothetical protein